MSIDTTPIARAIAALSDEDLLRFLGKQRWFASKAQAPSTARIVDTTIAPWGGGTFALARLAVTVGDETRLYQLPLAVRETLPEGVPDRATIAQSNGANGAVTLFDAAHDAEFRRGLATAIVNNVQTPDGDDPRWQFEAVPGTGFTAPPDLQTKLVSTEQSNSSIIVGDQAILKLFRTLATGIHPDAEVSRFLTARGGYRNTPEVLGVITIVTPEGPQTAGMLQRLVPGATDAWEYALEKAKPYFAAPATRDVPNALLDDARRLGAITRAMHEALASDDDDPAFAPEPAAREDLDRWAHRTQHTVRSSLALLERQLASGGFPAQRAPEAQALVKRGDHYVGWINEIDDLLDEDLGMSTRVHGDYHLGQVLRTGDGDFMIIDFEGEPSKSVEERREKTSPLRDVAGMLRSFAYAAATLSMGVEQTIDAQTRELRSARWERDTRNAFLAGYLGDPAERDDHPDVLPEDEGHVKNLIVLFEMEKVFYELAYELNNRPDWAWIPMRGISKLAVR